MSVNISLGDNPGISAYFDGQPIQDELEAEVRREEERQQKELRDLLATELEDFEEDFLSDSNSEEDSVNVSRVSRASSTSHRSRQHEQLGALQQASDKLVGLAPDSSGNHQSGDYRHMADASNNAYYSPVSKHHPGTQNPQHLLRKHQQNLLQQQHHQSHHHHQQQQSNHDEYSDDWMMRVQQTHAVTVSSSASSPHLSQPHHHRQQQQHQFYSPIPHHPANIAGVVDNTPVSLPNNLHGLQQQAFPSPVVQSALPQTSTSALNSAPKNSTPVVSNARESVPKNADDFDNYQVQYKSKPKKNDVNENDFYIQNENVEFFKAEGGEEKRSYEQLEVLYRVRGRELEDLTWKLKQAEEDMAKEARMYKHKLALANGDLEGGQESLRQCQSLLQQSKADLTESQALVRSLETQVAGLKEAKEELIKKLQVAESTIENLSHQCEELQQSDSLSRMRNEHENVVASLTQRFERELLTVKEKLDETKNNLEMKHDETVWLKKQLADSTKELEQAQISRGETINRLAKSLEDSQRQCQALLEQSSSQEIAAMRVKLQQTIASKSVSEETCIGLQSEIKELKEQLSMFEAASALGAMSTVSAGMPSHTKVPGKGLDDSMTDLGIKKTLDFDTPSSTPKLADTSSLEELVTSLRSELEKCLQSNRQKRSDIAEKAEQIQSLKQELQLSHSKSQDLEKTCVDQKMKLKDLESMMSNSNGESILEIRLRREIDALAKEKDLLLEDIEDYKKRIEEVGASEAKLTEINTELSAQIAQMVSDFDSDKATALDRCQRTLEEVHQLTLNNMRTELEDRLGSEKSMLMECHKMELDRFKDQLNAAQEEAHSLKTLYIKTCDEMKQQETETREQIRKEVEEELATVARCREEAKETTLVQEEKKKRICVEESLAKEKEMWSEREDAYQKEIKSSKDIIAEINTTHEKNVLDLQTTISSLKSQHKEDLDALNEEIANLVSRHQSEITNLKEESKKLTDMKMHFESQLELVEKQYAAKKEELENVLAKERDSKITNVSGANKSAANVTDHNLCVETKNSSIQTDVFTGKDSNDGNAEGEESTSRERLAEMQARLNLAEDEHVKALESLRIEHKKEFERAARNREEKFQVELRYFLKDKDDKFKERLDQALRKCEADTKVEFEKVFKDKETEIEHLKKELVNVQLATSNVEKKAVGDVGDKIMESTIQKLNTEKSMMERRIQDLEKEKKEELCRLQEKYASEEKVLMEKYKKEIELLRLNHSKDCEELQQRIRELEDQCISSKAVDDRQERDDVRRVLSARVREERARWFQDAQEYIKNEIETGIAEREKHSNNDDAWNRKLNDEVKRNVETELNRMKIKMELEIEQEVDERVKEQLDKEISKMKKDRENSQIEDKRMIEVKVKQKLSVEVENLKLKFLSELEARVAKEKEQLEEDVKKWKEDMRRKIDEDKKSFVTQVNRDVELKVSEEKKKAHVEVMQEKQEELRQMRAEMEEEMRKRIERERMDWQKEEEERKKRMKDGEGVQDSSSIRHRLKVVEEACNKAYSEKEKAVDLLKRREASYKEDKQKLVAGLKQLRQDLNSTKEEQAVLEERYAQMDRKYKEDMREAKIKKDMALEKLQAKCDEEKEQVILDYKNRMTSMKEDFSSQVDRVKSEAEVERAALLNEVRSQAERALTLSPLQEPDTESTTLFELRDHYLETVSKIKEDVMSHVQAANSRAATTMKSEMRKQRRRLIHMFKERCKASIRSILTGQVPSNVLNSLDQAIDIIAEAVVTTPKSATSNATTGSPLNTASENSTPRDNRNLDQELVGRSERRDKSPYVGDNVLRETENAKNPRLQSESPHPLKYHPQLAKVDLYDSEAIDSSPQTSHNSSPASISRRTKSVLNNVNKPKSSPIVPHLNLSPFHNEKEHSTPISEDQQRRIQYPDGYSNEGKQNHHRPRSAEYMKGQKSNNTPSEAHNTNMVKNADEPSPRDRMKMIEAQVRLANWAASGEMPWKGPKSGSQGSGGKHRDGDGDKYDNHLFIIPGEEAERFLRAQRSTKNMEDELVTPMKRDRMERKPASKPYELDGYVTDDSSVSMGSHSSFITLEPDGNQKSQLNMEGKSGKDWPSTTTDYDRIKSALSEMPERTFVNVTHRRVPRAEFAPSDDDARSMDSDDVQHYRGMPTSTPAKRNHQEQDYHRSRSHKNTKSAPDKHRSKFSSPEHESQGWKTVNAFSEIPASRHLHREHSHEKRSNSQPRPSRAQPLPSKLSHQRLADNAKSTELDFPDISEITYASGDGHVGGGMWRYKSLEDLLPQNAQGREMRDEQRHNPLTTGYTKKNLSVAKTAPPPIQAMDSDFWQEQSLEVDEEDDNYRKRGDHRRIDYQNNFQSKRSDHKSPTNRNPGTHHREYDYDRSDNSPYSHPRQTNSKHTTEPSWSKKQSHRNPAYSSSSTHPTHPQSRNKTSHSSPLHHQHQQKPSNPYSPFDAHVDDLRKSLESMEANPFSSMSKHKGISSSKSKMKRSVSEQSLHTIQWDQDKSADIDDLVNAYTTGEAGMSHFDLHNFGHEEAF